MSLCRGAVGRAFRGGPPVVGAFALVHVGSAPAVSYFGIRLARLHPVVGLLPVVVLWAFRVRVPPTGGMFTTLTA